MRRRLLDFLAALSLLLCLAALAIALRGLGSGGATFGPQNGRLSWRFTWRDGRLYTYFCPGTVYEFSLDGRRFSFAGVRIASGRAPGGTTPVFSASMHQAHVWAAVVVFAVVAVLRARRVFRDRRRPPPGTCRRCGYDLRATPELCPECGELVAAPGAEVRILGGQWRFRSECATFVPCSRSGNAAS